MVVFPGSNGDRDLWEAFALAGFAPRYIAADEVIPADVHVVGLPGGFSYGDYWRAGVLASRSAAMQSLPTWLKHGGLVIGICNGFQILVEAGLIPGALWFNEPSGFRHRWIDVQVSEHAAASPWFNTLQAGAHLHIPMAHGEGNYQFPNADAALTERIPLTYTNNPNGSVHNAAALCSYEGRVLGIMPHPERACEAILGSTHGFALFQSAFNYCQTRH